MRYLIGAVFLAALPEVGIAAPSQDAVETVSVPGGVAAMAQALGLEPRIDRARAVAEFARLIHEVEPGVNQGNDIRRRKLEEHLATAATSAAPSEAVPIPLSRAVWEKAVFGRETPNLLAAILTDRRASLLCYGLASLDDETLAFFAANPEFLSRLYGDHPGAVAAFGASIRIRNGRIMTPGGPAAAPMWEALLGDSADRPERFIRWLFRRPFAPYIYDLAANVNAPAQAFMLGSWMPDPRQRVERLRHLIQVAVTTSRLWDVEKRPFVRPPDDVATLITSMRAGADGRPQPPNSRRFWERAFEAGELPEAPDRVLREDRPDLIDAAWIAERILVEDFDERRLRASQFAFGQRLAHAAGGRQLQDTFVAVRAFRQYRALMLILERIGVKDPATYARAARTARAIGALDRDRRIVALQQLQGALSLVARLRRAKAISIVDAASVARALVERPVGDRGYAGGVLSWLSGVLAPALKLEAISERQLIDLAAGAGHGANGRRVSWEGESYAVDLARGEVARVLQVRTEQGGPSLDEALKLADELAAGEALASIAFAFELRDAKTSVSRDNLAVRHDFGLLPWKDATVDIVPGQPWRTRGSILALDLALGHLGLQRPADGAIADPSRILSENERNTLTRSFGAMNVFDLEDAAQSEIAAAIQRGRTRVDDLTTASDSLERLDVIAGEIQMDGWRRRAAAWALTNDPGAVASYFTMTDYLRLGSARLAPELSGWGMVEADCYCLRLPPRFEYWAATGREQRGLVAAQIPDLNLHVAVILERLHLPPSLTKAVLATVLQEYLDRVRPTDGNDWLTLVRTVQGIRQEQIEDVIAGLAVNGPLYSTAGPTP